MKTLKKVLIASSIVAPLLFLSCTKTNAYEWMDSSISRVDSNDNIPTTNNSGFQHKYVSGSDWYLFPLTSGNWCVVKVTEPDEDHFNCQRMVFKTKEKAIRCYESLDSDEYLKY